LLHQSLAGLIDTYSEATVLLKAKKKILAASSDELTISRFGYLYQQLNLIMKFSMLAIAGAAIAAGVEGFTTAPVARTMRQVSHMVEIHVLISLNK